MQALGKERVARFRIGIVGAVDPPDLAAASGDEEAFGRDGDDAADFEDDVVGTGNGVRCQKRFSAAVSASEGLAKRSTADGLLVCAETMPLTARAETAARKREVRFMGGVTRRACR